MRYELWLGLRYLFARRRERFISIIALLSIGGVALGVCVLITVLSLMSGFDRDIKSKLVGTNAHIIVDTPQGVRKTNAIMRRLSAMEHIAGVSPFVTGQAILRLPNQAFGVLVRGIDVERQARVNRLLDYLVIGALPSSDDEIIIGSELSAYLRLGPGDLLTLISPTDGSSHEFTISGVFRSGMYEYDSQMVGITLSRAQRFYQLGDVVSGIGIKLDKLERSKEVKADIQRQLGPPYTVRTWMELNPALFGALRVEKILMFIVVMMIIVVAALNIASMLIMIVMERTKDIGVLRALGARRSSIGALFLWQGCVVGFLGILLGLPAGIALSLNLDNIVNWIEQTTGFSLFPSTVYYLDHLPVFINPADVTIVAVAAFLLTLCAGTYAALKAAHLAPVDALRYE